MTVDDLHPPTSTLELSLYVTHHQPIHHLLAISLSVPRIQMIMNLISIRVLDVTPSRYSCDND